MWWVVVIMIILVAGVYKSCSSEPYGSFIEHASVDDCLNFLTAIDSPYANDAQDVLYLGIPGALPSMHEKPQECLDYWSTM